MKNNETLRGTRYGWQYVLAVLCAIAISIGTVAADVSSPSRHSSTDRRAGDDDAPMHTHERQTDACAQEALRYKQDSIRMAQELEELEELNKLLIRKFKISPDAVEIRRPTTLSERCKNAVFVLTRGLYNGCFVYFLLNLHKGTNDILKTYTYGKMGSEQRRIFNIRTVPLLAVCHCAYTYWDINIKGDIPEAAYQALRTSIPGRWMCNVINSVLWAFSVDISV